MLSTSLVAPNFIVISCRPRRRSDECGRPNLASIARSRPRPALREAMPKKHREGSETRPPFRTKCRSGAGLGGAQDDEPNEPKSYRKVCMSPAYRQFARLL